MSLLLSYSENKLFTLCLGHPEFLLSFLIRRLLNNIFPRGDIGGLTPPPSSLLSQPAERRIKGKVLKQKPPLVQRISER